MRRKLIFAMTLALCLFLLSGCGPAHPEAEETGTFCRVEWVYQDGFIANADGRNIFVVYPDSQQFEEYDTVFIEFEEADLREETGIRPYFDDYEITYTHVLDHPGSIRPAAPGEPTFA